MYVASNNFAEDRDLRAECEHVGGVGSTRTAPQDRAQSLPCSASHHLPRTPQGTCDHSDPEPHSQRNPKKDK
jgi:hypothetical protein